MGCEVCPLAGRKPVPFEGHQNPLVYIVGSHVTVGDDNVGKALSDQAGQLARNMLNFLDNKNNGSWRVGYLSRCLDYDGFGGSKKPEPAVLDNCYRSHLEADILAANPEVIVALGGDVYNYLTKAQAAITRVRGRFTKVTIGGKEFPLLPVLHPTYALQRSDAQPTLIGDLNTAYRAATEIRATPDKVEDILSKYRAESVVIKTFAEFEDYVTRNINGLMAYDLETTAFQYEPGMDIVGFSLSSKANSACYVVMNSLDYQMPVDDQKSVLDLLLSLLKKNKVIVHNAMFEWPATVRLLGYEIAIERMFDTLGMARTVLLGQVKGFGLKDLGSRVGETDWGEDVKGFVEAMTTIKKALDPTSGGKDRDERLFLDGRLGYSQNSLIDLVGRISQYTKKTKTGNKVPKPLKNGTIKYVDEYAFVPHIDKRCQSIMASVQKIVVWLKQVGYSGQEMLDVLDRIKAIILDPAIKPNFGHVPWKIISEYGGKDANVTFRLFHHLSGLMDPELWLGYQGVRKQIYYGYRMERVGICFDPEAQAEQEQFCKDTLAEQYRKLAELPQTRRFLVEYKRKTHEEAEKLLWAMQTEPYDYEVFKDKFLNFGSPDQAQAFLEIVMGRSLVVWKQDKFTKEMVAEKQTDDEWVQDHFKELYDPQKHDIWDEATWSDSLRALVCFRIMKKTTKVLTSYVWGFNQAIYEVPRAEIDAGQTDFPSRLKVWNPQTWDRATTNIIVQAKFHVVGADTGRWRSSDPSVHTMPAVPGRGPKDLFYSRFPGGVILAPDYSQNEVRVLAAVSGAVKLLEGFAKGMDPHLVTASLMFGIPPEQVTKEQRRFSKNATFATLYGKGEQAFADDFCGGDINRAREIFAAYFEANPEIKRWIEARHADVQAGRPVRFLTHRQVYISTGNGSRGQFNEAMRCAQNYPIQGPSSDIGGEAGYEIVHDIHEQNLRSLAVCFVHDSLEFDVHPHEILQMVKLVGHRLNEYPMRAYGTPCAAEVTIGTTFGKECKIEHVDGDPSGWSWTLESRKDYIDDLHRVMSANYDIVEVEVKKEEPKEIPVSLLFEPKIAMSMDIGRRDLVDKTAVFDYIPKRNGKVFAPGFEAAVG